MQAIKGNYTEWCPVYFWSKGSFTRCDVRLRFLRYRNWIVWMLMTLFTWCDLLCVCDVTHEWVPYPFCVIAMCNSKVSILQITSKPITPCEQFQKIACIKLLLHAGQIAPCEQTLKSEAVFHITQCNDYLSATSDPLKLHCYRQVKSISSN